MPTRMMRWLPKPPPIRRLLAKAMSEAVHADFDSAPQSATPTKPDEMSWRDYTLLLLHIGAELEHCLMVQYLFAAWTLGGPQVPEDKREKVREWQDAILSIAKEEMGHFLTVQNVLCLLGGPVALQREDFPWDSEFYPFPFCFEPLTPIALAKYIYAEAPENWGGPIAEKVANLLQVPTKMHMAESGQWHHVAELYNKLIAVLSTPGLLKDSDFDEWRYPAQGSFAEWARNHGHPVGDEANDWQMQSGAKKTPATSPTTVDMIIEQVATRDQAIAALKRVSEQGEGTALAGERSHFQRFIKIFLEYIDLFPPGSEPPYRQVAINPTTLNTGGAQIEHPTARRLAALFDLRYRALLMCVAQELRLAKQVEQHLTPGARASLLQHSFVEMYNLKALSSLLVRAPLINEQIPTRAGPPFQLPYALELPQREIDTWRAHLDLLDACENVYAQLQPDQWVSAEFIAGMRNADSTWRSAINVFLTQQQTN